jgi:predicted glycosyltransferase
MKIICDIGHPAHVHLFKNALWEFKRKGHQYLITTRDKDVTLQLLKAYNMPYVSLGRHYNRISGKLYGMLKFDSMLFTLAKQFKPDMFISHGSIYAAHVSTLIGKPHISMEDTENSYEQIRLYRPFTKAILTSKCFQRHLGRRQFWYDGYHELAYLHPNYFKPDRSVLDILGVKQGERYVILRFVSWEASHDITHKGISLDNKIIAAREFSKYARVFITSEAELPDVLREYQIKIPPERMHDTLYYAILLYGESATMASECAVCGTPAIFLDNDGRGYTDEEEKKYGLVYNFTESLFDQEKSIKKGIDLLKQRNLKQKFVEKQKELLNDKIDVTTFLVWFVENYPKSPKIMKKNPDYQLRFKQHM